MSPVAHTSIGSARFVSLELLSERADDAGWWLAAAGIAPGRTPVWTVESGVTRAMETRQVTVGLDGASALAVKEASPPAAVAAAEGRAAGLAGEPKASVLERSPGGGTSRADVVLPTAFRFRATAWSMKCWCWRC